MSAATGLPRHGPGVVLRPLLHRALLRGLRAPRVPHDPPITQRPLGGGRLRAAQPGSSLLIVDGDHDLREALAPQASRIAAFLAGHLGVTPR